MSETELKNPHNKLPIGTLDGLDSLGVGDSEKRARSNEASHEQLSRLCAGDT